MTDQTDIRNKLKSLLESGQVCTFSDCRLQNPDIVPSLDGFDAKGFNFNGFDLRGINLANVYNIELSENLAHTQLTGARLSNDQFKSLIKKGLVWAFNNFRQQNPDVLPNLDGLDARGVNFDRFNLSEIDLTQVDNLYAAASLEKAQLTNAQVTNKQCAEVKANTGVDLDKLEAKIVEPKALRTVHGGADKCFRKKFLRDTKRPHGVVPGTNNVGIC